MNLPFGSTASKNQNGRWIMGHHHSEYQASQEESTMIAPLTEITSALSKVQGSKTIKLSQEGIIAGTCGAATITLWFLLLDVLAGHPLYTPHMLGTALFKGGSGLMPSAHVALSLGMVGAFTALHWLMFELIGALAALLLALAEHNPNLGFGVLLCFVLSTAGLVGGTMMFAEPVLHALAWQSVLVGNLVAAGAMGGYLWRRHAHMVIYP
jgi:hypothetical protein